MVTQRSTSHHPVRRVCITVVSSIILIMELNSQIGEEPKRQKSKRRQPKRRQTESVTYVSNKSKRRKNSNVGHGVGINAIFKNHG